MAKMQEEMCKHLCHEDDDDLFTSEPERLSEAAGICLENTPSHLRGLKDYEIGFLLNARSRKTRCCKQKNLHP